MPKPTDDTPKADQPPEEAKVFLSYSRKDRERAQAIADVLRERHFGVFKDTDDILPTEEWKTRLEDLIEEADTIVFLLSPHSAVSEVCAWEVEYATTLNKRIAPIVIEDVEGDSIPPLLARLNFIFCTDRDPFENAVSTLVSALSTDIDWIREHTRIAGLARRWNEAGQPARLLLRGQDITDAEGWRDGHPKEAPAVTANQSAFIAHSRRAAGRRQRNWIVGSLAVAASAAALAVFAYFQSVEADRQRAEAETQRGVAEANATEADRQRLAAEANAEEARRERDQALTNQSLFLADLALQRLNAGDDGDALALAVSALPPANDLTARPIVPEALAALREVQRRHRMEYRFPDGISPAHALAAAPAGHHLIMALQDDAVVFDAEEIDFLAAYDGYEDAAASAAYSPTGDRFAIAAANGLVTIFDAETLDALTSSRVNGLPMSMAFSPDGAQLAIGTQDKRDSALHLLNAATAEEIAVWGDYGGNITGLSFDGPGKFLFTGSTDGYARIYDLSRLSVLGGVFEGEYGLLTIAFARHAPLLAIAESEETVVKNVESGEIVARFPGDSSPIELLWAPSGDLFVGQNDGAIIRWRVGQEAPVARYLGFDAPVSALALNADETRLFASSREEALITWRLGHEGVVAAIDKGHKNGEANALGPDGQLIRVSRDDAGALVEREEGDDLILSLERTMTDAGIYGETIITSEKGGRVTLWSFDGVLRSQIETGIADVDFARLTESGKLILASGRENGVRLFDVTTGAPVLIPSAEILHPWDIEFHGDVLAWKSETDYGIVDFSTADGERRAWPIEDGGSGLGLSMDGALLAVARTGKGAEIIDWRTRQTLATLSEPHGETPKDFTFSPDRRYLAVEGALDWVALWRAEDWTLVRLFRHDNSGSNTVFSLDGSLLAMSEQDGRVKVVRTSDGKAHMSFPGDDKTIIDIAFAADSSRLLVSTVGGKKVWPLFPDDQSAIESAAKQVKRVSRLTPADECRYFLKTGEACAQEAEKRAYVITMPLPD